ncbi:MAG: hypothetical protein IRZ13_00955 [Acetobacteraceae bacterium]|nr:hypothetical protein [Acetobacteraceae bacterium]
MEEGRAVGEIRGVEGCCPLDRQDTCAWVAGAGAGKANWLVAPPEAPFACTVKLRAGGAQPAVAHWDAATALPRLALEAPGIAAPGQAVVLYDGDRALGGGSIRAAEAGAQAPRRAVA